MKEIFLYLDESGDFEKDGSLKDNPSIVGGVLSFDKEISKSLAEELLEGKSFHGAEILHNKYASIALPVLREIKAHGWDMVVFENKERLEVVDGDTTYLNIISEGLIQLLQFLIADYGEVRLNVLVAVRRAVNRKDYKARYIIDRHEYINRLQEKIIIGLARKSNTSISNYHWGLDFGSANKDHRLMLADLVCHSWFRKNRKFTNEQKKELEDLYQEKFVFSVFPNDLDVSFQRMMLSGNVGDAVYEVMTASAESKIGKFIGRINAGLNELDDYSRELQFQILFNKVKNLYHVDWSQNLVSETINRLKTYFVKEIELSSIPVARFLMDLHLLACTIATHKGDIHEAEEELKVCETMLPMLAKRWEGLDYYFIYSIRKGVHLLDSYEPSGCIKLMDELEDTIDNTVSLFPLANGLKEICTEIKSDLKGKVLGTRLQARVYLIKNYSDQLNLTRSDSDRAMVEFTKSADIKRQYQYRCRIEYEAGNYKEALKWLSKSLAVDPSNDYGQLIKSSLASNKQEASFSIMHYASIMAEACMAGDAGMAKKMNKCWDNNRVNDYFTNVDGNHHPYEIIYWKLATLLMLQGNIKAAMEKYGMAIHICDKNPQHQVLKAISLGIKAELVALLMKNMTNKASQKYLKVASNDLTKAFYSFMNLKIPLSMKRHFIGWRPLIEGLKEDKVIKMHEELLRLSRQVYY